MTRTKRLMAVAVSSTVVAIAAPATASAASRYASPTGSGTACTLAQPCDVVTAVNSAGSNDDITVEPGTYTVSTELVNANTISVHGQAGQPRPVLSSQSSYALVAEAPNTTISDLEIDAAPGTSNNGIFVAPGATKATIDRVLVRDSASINAIACRSDASVTITNTLCEASGDSGATAMYLNTSGTTNATMTLRNDTVENTGGTSLSGGNALLVAASSGNSDSVTVSNSILRGTASDVFVTGSTATVTADHSNYGSVSASGGASVTPAGSGTNQTNSPHFVNPTAGDFHELGNSPTVDAGADASANGQFDLDGNPRAFGAATDIGAYEYIPPPTCQPVNATTATGTPVTVQLSCADALGGPVTYAITTNPGHGTVSLNAGSGQATFTPANGYSGSDSFSFDATSSNGTSAPATASITISPPGSFPAPRDSKPKLSPTTFMAFASGPSIVAAKARGTLISYTDTESAATVFTVQRAVGTGVLSHGKCVKPSSKHNGRKCTRYQKVGRFKHADNAGLNRFRFTGRVAGKALRPGHYRLVSRPVNAAGKTGASHTNSFTIVR